MPGRELARAAQQLVGCRFRLHGRDPETGLDCIGVLAAALRLIGRPCRFPSGYRLRTGGWPALSELAALHSFEPAQGSCLPGDVLFTEPGPLQLHLAISAIEPALRVEAHLGLGRVVIGPARPGELILQRWRLSACA